jgi:hypothetical protein
MKLWEMIAVRRASKISLALLTLSFASPASAAEDFTFTAIGTDGLSAWVKLDGRLIGATSSTVVSTAIGVGGRKTIKHGRCQSWTPDPAGPNSYETVCNYIDQEGAYATISWCPKDMSKGCSGKLVGVSGVFANRRGTFSVSTKPGSAEGTDNYTGTGHWD